MLFFFFLLRFPCALAWQALCKKLTYAGGFKRFCNVLDNKMGGNFILLQ
jgi:hypothetical protein